MEIVLKLHVFSLDENKLAPFQSENLVKRILVGAQTTAIAGQAVFSSSPRVFGEHVQSRVIFKRRFPKGGFL
jgi:hypothetical protein